jgi:hypothetical protein
MERAGVRVLETIELPGWSARDVERRVLQAMDDGAYRGGQLGPSRYLFVRAARPVWATLCGIVLLPALGLGVLLLLMRRTESCTLTITDTYRGTTLSIEGRLLPEQRDRLRGAVGKGPVVDLLPDPPAEASGIPEGARPADDARIRGWGSQPVGGPMPSPLEERRPAFRGSAMDTRARQAHTVARPGAPGSIPAPADPATVARPTPAAPAAATSTVARPAPAPGRDAATVARTAAAAPSEPAAPAASAPTTFALRTGGALIAIDPIVVLGRAPAAPAGRLAAARPVALDDPSMQVSKTHLAVWAKDGILVAEDLRSTNGSQVVDRDGTTRVLGPGQPLEVQLGARLLLGGLSLEVVAGG